MNSYKIKYNENKNILKKKKKSRTKPEITIEAIVRFCLYSNYICR